MSLNYDFENIHNYKEVVFKKVADDLSQKEVRRQIRNGASYYYREDEDGNKIYTSYMNPVTNALIWATLGIGLSSITEANYVEFHMRMAMEDAFDGGRIHESSEDAPRSVTLAEVHQHIGLSTNVAKEAPTKWYGKRLKRQKCAESRRVEKEEAA
ncbi:MAG: hypothetical protein DRQ89_12530 [Epsilonproteobacteria bacterium]|nr:MAG: hypothetical protein DRQ89_12530 [Campylobacterota bacterium]